MLAVNLGTRGTLEALDLLEYSNIPGGTALSDRRAANGRTEPFDVRMWCLGNEMDGPWQLGHRSADDYGKLAVADGQGDAPGRPRPRARGVRLLQRAHADLRRVGAGRPARTPTTTSTTSPATRTTRSATATSAASSPRRSTWTTSSRRSSRRPTTSARVKGSTKKIDISFDEWNVWYIDRYHGVDKIDGVDNWPVAPRLLEDAYSVADAVVFGNLLISLLKHADRVTSASLAQLVNVIAPIMTEPGGPPGSRPPSSRSRRRRASPWVSRSRCASSRRPTRPRSTARCRCSMPWPPMTPRPAPSRSSW